MTVYLRFDQNDVDEENDKVMLNVLVSELLAFVLLWSEGVENERLRIELDGHCLSSRLYRETTRDGSIRHSDNEAIHSTQEEDSLANVAASTTATPLVVFTAIYRPQNPGPPDS